LAAELTALGAENVKAVSRGVLCEGSDRLMYRANLELRTGLRVYKHLADVNASSPDELYYGVGDYDWERILPRNGTFWVTSTANQTEWVLNTMIVTLKTKDAIVDKLRIGESRPNVDRDRPDLRIHTYVHNGQGSIWLDSTGDPLFKRGYRLRTLEAPINEVLAAGILSLSGYSATTPLVDPMCGSGTFLIEASRMAMNIPSQNERQFFAFMNWPDFDSKRWQVVRQQALSRVHRGQIAPIIGSDLERRAIRYADRNIHQSGLSQRIELHEADFFHVSAPFDKGMLIMNPPYDERLSIERGANWYEDIGHSLKHYWAGWEANIVSGFKDGLHSLKLTPKRKILLDNGGIPVELWKIPLYAGSKYDVEEVGATRENVEVDNFHSDED